MKNNKTYKISYEKVDGEPHHIVKVKVAEKTARLFVSQYSNFIAADCYSGQAYDEYRFCMKFDDGRLGDSETAPLIVVDTAVELDFENYVHINEFVNQLPDIILEVLKTFATRKTAYRVLVWFEDHGVAEYVSKELMKDKYGNIHNSGVRNEGASDNYEYMTFTYQENTHKTLQKRYLKYYNNEEIPKHHSEELDWGPDVGAEVLDNK